MSTFPTNLDNVSTTGYTDPVAAEIAWRAAIDATQVYVQSMATFSLNATSVAAAGVTAAAVSGQVTAGAATVIGTSGTVTVTGNAAAGTIAVSNSTTGITGPGVMVKITFPVAKSVAPVVIVTPNDAGAIANPAIVASTTTYFTVAGTVQQTTGTNTYKYLVIGS
jgi:hypothetical protein